MFFNRSAHSAGLFRGEEGKRGRGAEGKRERGERGKGEEGIWVHFGSNWGPKCPQEDPGGPQEAPGCPQDAPRRSQEAAGWPQEILEDVPEPLATSGRTFLEVVVEVVGGVGCQYRITH